MHKATLATDPAPVERAMYLTLCSTALDCLYRAFSPRPATRHELLGCCADHMFSNLLEPSGEVQCQTRARKTRKHKRAR